MLSRFVALSVSLTLQVSLLQEIMRGFVRQIRIHLDAASAAQGGGEIALGVRLTPSWEVLRSQGLDGLRTLVAPVAEGGEGVSKFPRRTRPPAIVILTALAWWHVKLTSTGGFSSGRTSRSTRTSHRSQKPRPQAHRGTLRRHRGSARRRQCPTARKVPRCA